MFGEYANVKSKQKRSFKKASKGHWGITVLHEAAYGGLAVIKYLVGQGADVHAKTRGDHTVLHEAAYAGNLDLVKFLVGEGLAVTDVTMEGRTVLHYAVTFGFSLELVKYLVEQGVDVDARGGNTGGTARDWAVLHSNTDMERGTEYAAIAAYLESVGG